MSDALRARLTALDAALQAYGYSALPCAQCRRAGSITVHDLHDLLAALLREPPAVPSWMRDASECLGEIWVSHRDRDSGQYNECEKSPCAWCTAAERAMQGLQAAAAPENPR